VFSSYNLFHRYSDRDSSLKTNPVL
jgi:hypothetical protein